jgi:hypothetical protein
MANIMIIFRLHREFINSCKAETIVSSPAVNGLMTIANDIGDIEVKEATLDIHLVPSWIWNLGSN